MEEARSETRPIRVAIIGGGCAAMTTAYELSRPEHGGRYAVTVYQQGWRVGGKGASGRGPSGRIEEHGLHLWMGWYENAFRLMRDCYAELDRDPTSCPIATWRDAFEPAGRLGVMQRETDGRWRHWTANFPTSEDDLPGDAYPEGHRWTLAHYLVRGAGLVRALLESLGTARSEGGDPEAGSKQADGVASTLAGWIERLGPYGEVVSLTWLAQAAGVLQAALRTLDRSDEGRIVGLIGAIARNAGAELESLTRENPEARRLWTLLDLTLATMRGVITGGLLYDERGLEAIDDWECSDWLMHNGASRTSVESGYLRGLYDLGFSYEDADPGKPRIAAGQGLRAMIRSFFTYRGAFFWRMNAGMGDAVFAPLYEVMRRRGVRFEFFHRLENVGLARGEALAGDAPHVAELRFDVQARVLGGRPFEPLVDVKGLPCWPSEPDWSQLELGDRMRREEWRFECFWDRRRVAEKVLRVGEDFDLVVLGVGVGAVPHVCREIVDTDPRWRTMVEHVKTVATQAFQLWLRPDIEQLGWTDEATAISGYVEPFDTWANMGHLIPREEWEDPPGALAYFCNVLPDLGPDDRSSPSTPAEQHENVRRNSVHFLENDLAPMWPGAVAEDGAFRWDLLVGSSGPNEETSGEKRFESQFWTANVSPSDRYALSLPGSLAKRISPLDTGYDNLTVAGDWTRCGFMAGCVEAAVMSGLVAAHAVSQKPHLEDIIGYDHP